MADRIGALLGCVRVWADPVGAPVIKRQIVAAVLFWLCLPIAHGQHREVLSFTHNTAIEYSSKGHPKAAGLHITLRYPSSWRAEEGNRPHIVQKFVSSGGGGFEMCSLVVVASPEVISRAESEAAVTTTALRKYVPPGAIFISAEPTTLDGLPAGIITHKMTQHTAGQSITVYARAYVTIYNSRSIQLQCTVGARSDSDALVQRFGHYSKSVFALIANSLVVQDRWATGNNLRAPDPKLQKYTLIPSDRAMSYIELIISLAVTWGLGLAPALIIRFGIKKAPLAKGRSVVVALLVFAGLYSTYYLAWSFVDLGEQFLARSHPAFVLVAFVTYSILRFGARTGDETRMSESPDDGSLDQKVETIEDGQIIKERLRNTLGREPTTNELKEEVIKERLRNTLGREPTMNEIKSAMSFTD